MSVLFDSQSWVELNPADYVEDYLECCGKDRSEYETESKLHEDISNWLYDNVEQDWKDFLDECSEEENHHCLVTGYFMAWNGPREGGKIYSDLKTAVQEIVMDDSHPIFSINDKGVMVLDETHHDAPCSGNHYEFLILTDAGEQYYEKHIYDDRKTLHDTLKTHNFTRNVNTRIFGFTTVEVK